MKKITLILGGIRSGKSFFAEQRAEKYAEKPVYVATSVPFDDDMKARVQLHRERRGDKYELIEAPDDLIEPLSQLEDRTVLVDCLTIHLSNRLLAKEENLDLQQLIEEDEAYLAQLHRVIERNRLKVIFVSNEVGMAPVSVNKLGRYFQDLQGRWNRIMAAYASEVWQVRAGIPSLIKKEPCFPFRISAPSYVLPTGYIENVTYLLDKVEDIQLLAFDAVEDDPLLKDGTLRTLEFLAKESSLTYSVHMPVKPELFTEEGKNKRLETATTIMEAMKRLKVTTHTFHFDLPGGKEWRTMTAEEKEEVPAVYIDFFRRLRQRFPNADMSLENTGTPVSALDGVVEECALSYAVDIGHLAVQDWDISEVEPRLPRASVVHIHGLEEQGGKRRDHRAIRFDRRVFRMLETFTGILTVENYHPLLLKESLRVLRDYF